MVSQQTEAIHRYALGNVPANAHGRRVIRDLRKYLNRERWKLVVKHNGPRNPGAYNTRSEDATSHRIYFNDSDAYRERERERLAREWNEDREQRAMLNAARERADRLVGQLADADVEAERAAGSFSLRIEQLQREVGKYQKEATDAALKAGSQIEAARIFWSDNASKCRQRAEAAEGELDRMRQRTAALIFATFAATGSATLALAVFFLPL